MTKTRKRILWLVGLALLIGAPAAAVIGATKFNGVQIVSQGATPCAAGTGCLWWDGNTTGPVWHKADNTSVTLGGGASVAIGSAITGGTNGSILGVNAGNLAQDNTSLFWDFTNHRLGIGTNAPGYGLDIRNAADTSAFHLRTNGTTDDGLYINAGANGYTLASGAARSAGTWIAKAASAQLLDTAGSIFDFYGNTGLVAGNTFSPTQIARISAATVDFSMNTGTFKTSTGVATFGGSSNTFTNAVGIGAGTIQTQLDIINNATGSVPRMNINTTATDSAYVGYQFSAGATFKGGYFLNKSTGKISIWTTAQSIEVDTSGNTVFSGYIANSLGAWNLNGVSGINLQRNSTTFMDVGVANSGAITVASGKFITTATSATVPPAITWTAPSFLNSWVNMDTATYYGAGYYKDAVGWVHLRGLIKSGSNDFPAFQLPVGYRPTKKTEFVVSAGGTAPGDVEVDASGNVIPRNWFTGTNVGMFASLDGIEFYAEQ